MIEEFIANNAQGFVGMLVIAYLYKEGDTNMLIFVTLGATVDDGVFYQDVEYLTEFAKSNKGRVLTKACTFGDDAVDDYSLIFLANGYELGEVYNHSINAIAGTDLKSIYGFIPPNSKLEIKANGTSVTNAVYLAMHIKDA